MIKRTSGARRLMIGLAALGALLSAVVAVEFTYVPSSTKMPEPTATDVEPLPKRSEDQRFEMEPLDEFAEITERPLFNETRRPIAEEAEVAEEVADDAIPETSFVLSGVLMLGDNRTALIQSQESAEVLHVREGQEFGGWTIEAILPHKIVIRRGETSGQVLIEDAMDPKKRATEVKRRDRASAQRERIRAQRERASALEEKVTGERKDPALRSDGESRAPVSEEENEEKPADDSEEVSEEQPREEMDVDEEERPSRTEASKSRRARRGEE